MQAISQSRQPVQSDSSTKRADRCTVARGSRDHASRTDGRHLRLGQDGDVGVVSGRRHLRGRDAAGAVEGGEDLAEQDHLAPDRRLLLDHQHAVAHVAELDRGLHAADPAADDQRVVGGRDLHRRSTPTSSASNSVKPRTCRVNGSAQTEQMAAIFTLRPSIPRSAISAWAAWTMRDGARRAVGEVAALLAVGGDEDPVEALLEGVEDPARAHPAGAGQADHDHLRRVVHVRAPRQVDARIGDAVGGEDQHARPVRRSGLDLRGGSLHHRARPQLTWPGGSGRVRIPGRRRHRGSRVRPCPTRPPRPPWSGDRSTRVRSPRRLRSMSA